MRFSAALILLLLLPVHMMYAKGRHKGKWYGYAETGVMKEVDYFESYQLALHAGAEYSANPLRSFGCELYLWQFIEKDISSTGVGLRPVIRHYMWRAAMYNIFLEVKGGVILMTPAFPYGGTQFNFTLTGGLGGDIYLTERAKLLITAKYNHLSNWNITGEFNNPSWDGIGLTCGLMWRIR